MARKFKSSDVLNTQTIFGVGGLELDMVGRLNQMISNQNLGHTGSFRGGAGAFEGGHTDVVMPAQQNFQSPALLRSMGNTVNHRAGMNQGLPNTQPPVGFPNPMLNLLLPANR